MSEEKKMKIIDIEQSTLVKVQDISMTSVEKMSSKELKAEVIKLREMLISKEKINKELSELVNELKNEKEKFTSVLEEERKEAMKVRKRALDQANTILADAKAAAEKLMAFAKNAPSQREEEPHIPGPDRLDLDELLSRPFQRAVEEETEKQGEESMLEEQISKSVPQKEANQEKERKSWDYISPGEKRPSIYEGKSATISDEANQVELKEETQTSDNRIESIHQRILNDYFK